MTAALYALFCVGGLPYAAPAQAKTPVSSVDPVLAQTRFGPILLSELESERDALSKDERTYRSQFALEGRVVSDLLQRIAMRRFVVQAHPDHPVFRATMRNRWAAQWRRDCYGLRDTTPTVEELARRYQPVQLERRIRLSHIFLAAETEQELSAARSRLARMRSEIQSFEEFGQQAQSSSDSQSARKQGRLGVLRDSWLQPGMEVLWEIDESSMSQPLHLRGGVHLFWVEKKFPAETIPPERRARREHRELRKVALETCREQRIRQAFERLPGARDPNQLPVDWQTLVVGEWPLRRKDWQATGNKRPPDDLAAVREQYENEALLQLAEASKWISADQLANLERSAGNELLELIANERALAGIEAPSEEWIEAHLADNTYRSVRKMAVRYLETTVPDSRDPIVFLRDLEAFSSALAAGEASWTEASRLLATEGRIEELPLVDVRSVAATLSPAVFSQLAPLTTGGVSSPVQSGESFFVAEIIGDRPAADLRGAEARQRALAFHRSQQRRQRLPAVLGELLTNSGFQLTEAGQSYLEDRVTGQRQEPFEP